MNGCLSLCVSSGTDWWPDVPSLSRYDSWDKLQPPFDPELDTISINAASYEVEADWPFSSDHFLKQKLYIFSFMSLFL